MSNLPNATWLVSSGAGFKPRKCRACGLSLACIALWSPNPDWTLHQEPYIFYYISSARGNKRAHLGMYTNVDSLKHLWCSHCFSQAIEAHTYYTYVTKRWSSQPFPVKPIYQRRLWWRKVQCILQAPSKESRDLVFKRLELHSMMLYRELFLKAG